MHRYDSKSVYSESILKFVFRFDEPLDAQVLKDSLEELLREDGWCRLAGRLRRNVSCAESTSNLESAPDDI